MVVAINLLAISINTEEEIGLSDQLVNLSRK